MRPVLVKRGKETTVATPLFAPWRVNQTLMFTRFRWDQSSSVRPQIST